MQSRLIPALFISLLFATTLAGCLAHTQLDPTVASAGLVQPSAYRLDPVAEDLRRPVQFVPDPRAEDRFFVAEMGGRVRSITADGPQQIVLDIADRLGARHREQGLLGLALHPSFPDDPRLFVTYTAANDDVVLSRFLLAPGGFDNETEQVLLRVPQHRPYHNGGHIAFGPDGHLYAAFGDGSPQGDPDGNAQDTDSLLGTIVRIDIDTDTADGTGNGWSAPDDNPFRDTEGRDEIWLYGLRNPWRFSFDAATGDLWVGDVGYLSVEEIDRVPRALGGGHNLGWPRWEGNLLLDEARRVEVPVLFPVYEYARQEPCSSVTGGLVSYDPALPGLFGAYLFADFCTGQIQALRLVDDGWTTENVLQSGRPIAGFGEGPDGAVYVIDHSGSVLRLVPAD